MDGLPEFIPGLQLSRYLYEDAVGPLLAKEMPVLRYAAALLGPGSEVQGFDTEQSRDHAWGPRLLLFLSPEDCQGASTTIDNLMRHKLPASIHGYPIDLAWNYHPEGPPPERSGTNHRVTVHTVKEFMLTTLGVDATRPLMAVDWLMMPQQLLRSVTAGAVFHDDSGELTAVRDRLSFYPDDIWYFVLAAQWRRIAQEEAFVGRTAQVGDELGSSVVAARLVRDVMHLCFLYERQYAPYIKWLGTAFSRLRCAPQIEPLLRQTLAATEWRARERPLLDALSVVGSIHNELGLTEMLPVVPEPFHERPFSVIHAERFEGALRQRIVDAQVRELPDYLGSVVQMIDTTDLLSGPDQLEPVRQLFMR